MDERFVKRLLASMKCGTCNKHYEASHINPLGRQGNVWFFSIYCAACQNHALIAAVIRGSKASEVITDLSTTELAEFNKDNTITADDILEIHSFLKDFDGDFGRIFSKRGPRK